MCPLPPIAFANITLNFNSASLLKAELPVGWGSTGNEGIK